MAEYVESEEISLKTATFLCQFHGKMYGIIELQEIGFKKNIFHAHLPRPQPKPIIDPLKTLVCVVKCVCNLIVSRNGLGPSKEGEDQYSVVHCTGYIKAWPPAGIY